MPKKTEHAAFLNPVFHEIFRQQNAVISIFQTTFHKKVSKTLHVQCLPMMYVLVHDSCVDSLDSDYYIIYPKTSKMDLV